MRYLPHTDEDVNAMLSVIGVDTLNDLFKVIPDSCCLINDLDLPAPLSEWELNDHMNRLSDDIPTAKDYTMFVGAGCYDHYVPHMVTYLLGRSEFSTAYTPYQPEMSQGTLQAIFEFQTLVSRLLGMEVANASLYDGASAFAEAMLMATRITRLNKVAVSRSIHPNFRRVLETYFRPTGHQIVELDFLENGRTDTATLASCGDLAAVAVQSPNFFGCVEDLQALHQILENEKTLLVVAFTEPLAYGLYKNPGELGADIVCGEGQSFGLPRSFGGPGLGMFACLKKFVRNMPGRLVGQTVDTSGKRGFVLTLATREQHIRREKATSNICTNSSLCALTSAMYMASLGGSGIRQLAQLNYDKSEYLKKQLTPSGFQLPFDAPTFNEFVVKFPNNASSLYRDLLDKKIMAGIPIAPLYPELSDHYLLCVTETAAKEDMDTFIKEVSR
jgi:glycine dehydrogenase subunit 1